MLLLLRAATEVGAQDCGAGASPDGSGGCADCGRGRYQDQAEKTACKGCPAGFAAQVVWSRAFENMQRGICPMLNCMGCVPRRMLSAGRSLVLVVTPP